MPVAQTACEYVEWYMSMPDRMLVREEQDCMYYLYQLHRSAEVLQAAGSVKAGEMMKKLDSYNRVLQTRLYGGAGMFGQPGSDDTNMAVQAADEAGEDEE